MTNPPSQDPKQNRFTFGLGTIGRDMVYTLVSMYLMFYLTDILDLPIYVLWWLGGIILFARIFDAVTDPIMGVIVDNTKTRWGRFKPWMAIGTVLTGIVTILLFTDFGLSGGAYIALFTLLFLLWGIVYMTNDISYWSMLPTLSVNQKEREKIGAMARICGNIGLFFVVAAIIPITNAFAARFGGLQQGWFVFAVMVVLIMAAGQCIAIFGVKETGVVSADKQTTSLRDLFTIIFKNDQLLFVAISMSLFMIGYVTTTSFGLYFFVYVYGNEAMYPIFAVILGISQLTALAVFPIFSKRFTRKTLYTAAIAMISVGYVVFFFAPVDTMLFIGIAGILMFVGQAFVQILMLMFLTDSVDYGHWKLGKRNDSVTFSLQPFINKMGGAIASGIVIAVVILSGIQDAQTAADVTESGLLMMRGAMLVFPMVCMIISYIVWRTKHKVDEKFYEKIMEDLRSRGEIS